MQREHISIPKLIAYVLFSVIIFALQTGTFGGMRIFGSAVDLLPALVTAAALLGGPAEAAVTGVTVGICYDLSFTGVDGLYPLFFLLFLRYANSSLFFHLCLSGIKKTAGIL